MNKIIHLGLFVGCVFGFIFLAACEKYSVDLSHQESCKFWDFGKNDPAQNPLDSDCNSYYGLQDPYFDRPATQPVIERDANRFDINAYTVGGQIGSLEGTWYVFTSVDDSIQGSVLKDQYFCTITAVDVGNGLYQTNCLLLSDDKENVVDLSLKYDFSDNTLVAAGETDVQTIPYQPAPDPSTMPPGYDPDSYDPVVKRINGLELRLATASDGRLSGDLLRKVILERYSGVQEIKSTDQNYHVNMVRVGQLNHSIGTVTVYPLVLPSEPNWPHKIFTVGYNYPWYAENFKYNYLLDDWAAVNASKQQASIVQYQLSADPRGWVVNGKPMDFRKMPGLMTEAIKRPYSQNVSIQGRMWFNRVSGDYNVDSSESSYIVIQSSAKGQYNEFYYYMGNTENKEDMLWDDVVLVVVDIVYSDADQD